MRRLIVNFFPLILGVWSNFTSGSVYQSIGVTKTLLKKSFELDPWKEIFDCLILLTLILVSTKADPIKTNQAANRVWLELVALAV